MGNVPGLLMFILSLLAVPTVGAKLMRAFCDQKIELFCTTPEDETEKPNAENVAPTATPMPPAIPTPTPQHLNPNCIIPVVQPCIYVAQAGDTLTGIVSRLFGTDSQGHIDAICEENVNLLKTRADLYSPEQWELLGFKSHCDLIRPGDRLTIPVI